jgi:hypothetical protein
MPTSSGSEQSRWFTEEVQPHGQALRAYLRKHYPDATDVDDVVQESYLRVLRARSPKPARTARRAFSTGPLRSLGCAKSRRPTGRPARSRDTGVDATCYSANPADVAQLCTYPFIFTNNLTNVRDPRHLANIREYLRRGGFIYIDRCVNLAFSLDQEPFYTRHLALFRSFLPGSEVRELPEDYPIHQYYFALPPLRRGSSNSNHSGIYGVYFEGRLAILLSCANLQCGWPNSPARSEQSKREIANIYVYAMTRAMDTGLKSP